MRLGLLAENETKLDFVLSLTLEKFLDRRLQTRVFQAGLAKSIHHARVLIKQRHIRYVSPCPPLPFSVQDVIFPPLPFSVVCLLYVDNTSYYVS